MSSSKVQTARLFVAASRSYSCLTHRAVSQLNRFLQDNRPSSAVAGVSREFSGNASRRLLSSRELFSNGTRHSSSAFSERQVRSEDAVGSQRVAVDPVFPSVVTPSTDAANETSCSGNVAYGSDTAQQYNWGSSSREDQDSNSHTDQGRGRGGAVAVGAAVVAAVGLCYFQDSGAAGEGPRLAVFPKLHAKVAKKNPDELHMSGLKLNHRERRFIKFASVEYHGQLYMTPQDFIESVTDSEPRQRLRRRQLTQADLDKFYQYTPPLRKGSSRMFREIYDKGIMSYTEYLFLLSILTKPQTGFHIAFNMFDTDGNERVDKTEFLVLMELLNGAVHKSLVTWLHEYSKTGVDPAKVLQARTVTQPVLESIFSTARRERLQRADGPGAGEAGSSSESLDDSLQKKHQVDTTLLVHFFGQKGKQDLKFEDFKMFMENLQTEVLEIEFNEFSKGLPTISELDFAKILLRYTHLQADQYEMYLERLIDKLSEEKGITFTEFKSFCQFLNTLEDFGIAMRMYTLAERPISQEEFHRAVRICTGHSLSPHIVETVYNIFDDDGDGQLSYKEFIAIMKDRLHRGFKHNSRSEGWEAFKHCIKAEMKSVI